MKYDSLEDELLYNYGWDTKFVKVRCSKCNKFFGWTGSYDWYKDETITCKQCIKSLLVELKQNYKTDQERIKQFTDHQNKLNRISTAVMKKNNLTQSDLLGNRDLIIRINKEIMDKMELKCQHE